MVIHAGEKPNMIMYNGKLREVHYSYSARIWYIEVNGKKITVDPNDLFGVNKNKTEWLDGQIERHQERITNYENLIAESKKAWSSAVDNLHNIRNSMHTLLNRANVKDASQLKGKEHDEYVRLSNDRAVAKTTKSRSSSDVISYAHSCMSEILEKGNCEQQRIVMNYLT